MVDLDALIPQRVPERLGDRLDVAAAVMDEQKIEIRVRAKLAASVATDSDQGDPTRRTS